MAQCHNCGAQVAEGAAACPECGAQFANQGQQPQGQPAGGPQGQPAGGPQARQPQGAYQKPRSAPAGIKALCIVSGIYGVILILLGTILGAAGSAVSQVPTSATAPSTAQAADAAGGMLGGLGAIFAVLGVATFVVIYGLWNLKDWGWIIAMALFGLNLLLSLWVFIQNGANPVPVLISAGLIAYLWTKRELYNAYKFLPIEGPQAQGPR